MNLCIPTLIRYDLCLKLIESAQRNTQQPDNYYIIDNGGGFSKAYSESGLTFPNIHIHTPGGNIGVSKSWNWFLKNVEGYLIIANDDLELSPHTLETMQKVIDLNQDPNVIMYSFSGLSAYSFFCIHHTIQERVGLFDESFSPAYFEDNDYDYRIKLKGMKRTEIHGLNIFHHGSATLREQRRLGLNREHDKNFNRNKEYYVKKWGGVPRHERYQTPFNK